MRGRQRSQSKAEIVSVVIDGCVMEIVCARVDQQLMSLNTLSQVV